MDPFVAVGLASSIVAFLDFGFKIVKAARAIQDSTSGATSQDEDLTFLSEKIKGLAIDLQPATPGSQMTPDEVRLGELAKTCTRLSDDLLKLIGKLQPANPASKRQVFRTALRAVRTKGEKEDLEKRLDQCRQQLHLQLSHMSRSETQSRLDQVTNTGKCQQGELTSLIRNVEILQQGVTVTSLGPGVLDQLSSLLRSTTKALDKTLQCRVMDALDFETMNDRFQGIEAAHEKTFNWLLGSSKDNGGLPFDRTLDEEQEKARADFVTWLTEGHGIFHITGKPGSGKSTLMKYLCLHPQTRSFLETWAQPKQLITANFFFWKPGSPLQKSMNGLMRAILHCLLQQAPDLVSSCLPAQWDAARARSASITLSDSDVQDAFDRLVTNPAVYQDHKFVFFIDGLDEFEGNHDMMVKRLLNWASASSANLKICVSSREWLVFQQRLAHCPSIRLHDLTSRDIRQLITATLEANEEFQELSKAEDPKPLIDALDRRSDGVFLWVTMVLRMTEQALLAEDRLRDLLAKINTTPVELESLYEQLFNSVLHEAHPIDQQFALKILKMISFVSDMNMKSESLLKVFKFSTLPPLPELGLLECLFLDDFDKNPRFAFSLPWDHDFDPDLESRRRRCRKQIYAHCKGLVHVGRIEDWRGGFEPVILTHRSISEFLRRRDIQSEIALRLPEFNVPDYRRQAYLAGLTVRCKGHHDRDQFPRPSDGNALLDELFSLIRMREDHGSPETITWACELLGKVSDMITSSEQKPSKLRLPLGIVDWDRTVEIKVGAASLAQYAATSLGLDEYWISRPQTVTNDGLFDFATPELGLPSIRTFLMAAASYEGVRARIGPRYLRSLALALEYKDHVDHSSRLVWWQQIILATFLFPQKNQTLAAEPILRLILLHRACPQIWFTLSTIHQSEGETSHLKLVEMFIHMADKDEAVWVPGFCETASLPQDIIDAFEGCQHGSGQRLEPIPESRPKLESGKYYGPRHGPLSLRDAVAFWFSPKRAMVLQKLIDLSATRETARPSKSELDQLIADPTLDLDTRRGISWEPHGAIWGDSAVFHPPWRFLSKKV